MTLCLSPGDEVGGRYRVERRLGSGGMGDVFAALDMEREQHVALKVFRQTSLADEVARERLLREGRAASRIEHPAIVRVHDIGAGELAYVAMELLDGEDLGTRIEREGALPIDACEQIARDLSEALHAMHDAGVVHRDIKPRNVFLTRDGGLKVLDFGLAKAEFLGDSLTEVQQIFGTLNYLSPEQLRSATLADECSDIWAFGAVMFEALTGRAAFPGRDAPQVVTTICTLDAPPVSSLRADVPSVLANVVRRCLRRDPALRYDSARALREALDGDVSDALPAHDAQTQSLTEIVVAPALPVPGQKERASWVLPLLAIKVIALTTWLLHAEATSADKAVAPRREPVAVQQCGDAHACASEVPVPERVVVQAAAPAPEAKPKRRLAKRAPIEAPPAPVPKEAPALVVTPAAPTSAAGDLQRSEF